MCKRRPRALHACPYEAAMWRICQPK
jgi:hypothetical protein